MPREPQQRRAAGLDAAELVPAPPATREERCWGAALLSDEPTLRQWLGRGSAPPQEQRGAHREVVGVVNDHPVVAVVVLSYNDRRTALRCLDSVDTLTYRNGAFFVVVVENSTERSQRLSVGDVRARRYGYRVIILRPDCNLGFAGGVNLAARYAFTRAHADHLLLLNDDVLIPKASVDLIQELVALQGLLPDVAAIGPKVYFERHPAGPDVVASAGASFIDVPPEVGRRDDGLRGIVESDFVVGACMLIPRRAWLTVGTFDARYFAYYEETDWCYRARRRGLRSYCLRDVYVLHGDHDRELHKRHHDPALTRLTARNQVLLARRHPWFCDVVAERLTRKYRQLLELGDQQAGGGMIEGIVLAERQCFPKRASRSTRIATIPARRRPPAAPPPKVAFYMGRISRRKGVDVLARLAARCPAGFEVHIRGISNLDPQIPDDNAYLHLLSALLRDSGAFRRNAVTIFGGFDVVTRDAFLRRYARSDAILVHPARPEGFGLVLLEAMAHGIPVVADQHGGLARAAMESPDPPMELVDFGAVGCDDLLRRLLERFTDRRGLARRRRRSRAYVAAHPSLEEMVDGYREHFLALCAACGIVAPAVTLLSGGGLYKVGGVGEWLASVGPRLHDDGRLRVSILTLPGDNGTLVARYQAALHGLPWEEFRIRLHRAALAPTEPAKIDCLREVIGLFAREEPPTSPLYARTLQRFHREIGRQEYWGMLEDRAAGELIEWYVESRPGLSRRGAQQGLALLLHGYLVGNLLAKDVGADACVYADDPATGLLAAVGRQQGKWGAYVLGLHSFTDLFYDETVDAWRNVRSDEREHFKRVIRHLLAYSVINADLLICVSSALEQHVRARFTEYPLPPIRTIPNTLLTDGVPRHRGRGS